jgi:iron(III) transport system permease protein
MGRARALWTRSTDAITSTRVRTWLPMIGVGLILTYLVAIPVAFVVVSSLKPTGFVTEPGFTLQHYSDLMKTPGLLKLVQNTAIFALCSTLGALTIAGTFAWLVERSDLPFARVVRVLIIVPMATPNVLLAIAWTSMLDPNIGTFNRLLKAIGLETLAFNVYSMPGMIFVEILSLVPTVYLMLAPAFRNMDPSMEEAAFTSGAKLNVMVRKVLLPILLPAFLGAGLFVLIVACITFDIPATLGVPSRTFVLSTRIVSYALHSPTGLPDYGLIAAMAVVILIYLGLLAMLYGRLTRRRERFVTVTGKGYRPRRYELGRLRLLSVTLVAAYFLLAVIIPFASLTGMSLLPYVQSLSGDALRNLTLENYRLALNDPNLIEATRHTLIVAVASGTSVVLLATMVSYVLFRTDAPMGGKRVLDVMSFAPIALSGVMMGTALVFVYLTIQIPPLYGTIWVIVIAYVTIYLAFATKVVNAALIQLGPELEEAARMCGASTLTSFRKVTLPIIGPALGGVWVWVVAHAIRELSSALILQVHSNGVVSTVLWSYWEGGRQTVAAAIGVLMLLTLLVLVAAWQSLSRRSDTSMGGM